jgi:hypothetical protein
MAGGFEKKKIGRCMGNWEIPAKRQKKNGVNSWKLILYLMGFARFNRNIV